MSYPSPPAGSNRSALLSGLRGQTPPSTGRPSPSGPGYPRLPPHTPQHRQRFPSSEHTLGPSFDDDDEDLEMVAKMAALNAGVYPYNGPQQHRQQQMPNRDNNGPVHRMQSPQGSAGRRLGMGGGDANHPSSINYQHQQQQELLRVLTMQTLAHNQGPRNLEELQLLQALAQQQQQREMEQQVEQLLRIQVHQQAHQLQQQLLAQQQQQAAMLAQQPNNNRQAQQQQRMGGGGGPPPPLSASFDQRSFEQSYAHAQQQVQLANQAQRVQQTPQQLASAYEQRHQAQQQIQANLRARSGVPALPTPAAVAASGHRFGFELDPPRDNETHGQGIFGNGTTRPTSQPRGLSPQPGAGAVGERTQPSPGPTTGPHETGPFGGLPLPASMQGQRVQSSADHDLGDAPVSLGGPPSLWTQAKSNTSGNWRTKPTDSPPPTHPRSVSVGVSSPAVSRFSGAFSPPPAHSREQSAPIARFQASHGLDGGDGRSESSSHPSRSNSTSDDNEGSRSPTSSEGPHQQTQTNTTPSLRWTNSGGSEILKPIYEGIGLGRPYPDKPSSPTPPSTGYGGARSLSIAAAAAALNHSQTIEEAARQQFGQRATPPVDAHPRTRSYEVGAINAGNGNVGQSFGSNVIRQPRGPPSPADELGARNFASRLRKKAGSNLSVLGRREQSASPSS